MNKPAKIDPNKFDEDGEPEWTAESQARMDAIRRSTEYLEGVEELKRLDPDDEGLTTEQTRAWLEERTRKWRAARGL